ncbi:amino acid ABC transporter permease [Marinomonas balearica]|uniref:Amino acid ABC transporter membrane protein 2 (PAAT family) n=1 Tax=Marinomonas balearica TaxID=491947 RepID=A0A4R6MG96_9GAMM|nr:amino acid ABC transporter permease [Marinomonas balearica]TDO99800.1 amino acid ABC transporter membrane protein 2 (PAAT family) [Marinomonas balearica]
MEKIHSDTERDDYKPLKKFVASPARPPKRETHGVIGTIRKRFFNSIGNSLLTCIALAVLFYLGKWIVNWAVIDAVFVADTRRQCFDTSPDGACWAGVISWFNGLIYGRFPVQEQWRVNLGVVIGIVWLLPLLSKRIPLRGAILLSWVALFPFVGAYLFLGGRFGQELGLFHGIMTCAAFGYLLLIYLNLIKALIGSKTIAVAGLHLLFVPFLEKRLSRRVVAISSMLVWGGLSAIAALFLSSFDLPLVPIERWGGLFLTFIIAGFSITMAIPVGVILALGRRSKLRVIHWLSLGVIEIVRSVPLITVLFMAVTLLPIFMPSDVEFNKLSQVLVAVCIFAGAYMAENIRGGLQAIPKGQFEAATTLGFGYWQTMFLIVLPQALRMMIPNIMTSFISLLKDTTLVSIIGLFDIMLMARNIANDKDWVGMHTEPLVLIAILFFVLCFSMSQYSLNLEKRIKVDR